MRTPIFSVSIALLAASAPLWGETVAPAAKPKPKAKPPTAAVVPAKKPATPGRPSKELVQRRTAVVAMQEQSNLDKAGRELMTALSDKDAMTRMLAVQGLGNLKYRQAREALSKVLSTDTSAETREAAALALRQINDGQAVDALAKAISDPVMGVRVTAMAGIGYYRNPKARPQVEAACKDSDPAVRRTAVHTLGQLEDPQAIPVVEPLLKDADPSVRAVAAQTLGDLRAKNSKTQLIELLKDPEKTVQVSAARALMKLGDNSGFKIAKDYALDENIAVRLLAIDTLGWCKDSEAGKILESLDEQVPANSRIALQEARARHEQMRKAK